MLVENNSSPFKFFRDSKSYRSGSLSLQLFQLSYDALNHPVDSRSLSAHRPACGATIYSEVWMGSAALLVKEMGADALIAKSMATVRADA